jgi:hypothetical protein
MRGRRRQLVAATAAVLLLLGLGRTAGPVDGAASVTATSVGHDAVVVGVVAGARVVVAQPISRLPALASTPPGPRPPAASGARDTTDGTSRTPAAHLVASTGDRAPPALP